ncbi:hypothetical protein V4Y02_23835, partial [Escherichia coli]
KIFPSYSSDKRLMIDIQNIQRTKKKTQCQNNNIISGNNNKPVNKWANEPNSHFSKEVQMGAGMWFKQWRARLACVGHWVRTSAP